MAKRRDERDDRARFILGRCLAVCRLLAGRSPDEAAKRSGVSRSAINRVEAGARDVTALELMRLADLYGLPIDQVFDAMKIADVL